MISIRRRSPQAHATDDGSGRIALIGILIVVALILGAIRLSAQ